MPVTNDLDIGVITDVPEWAVSTVSRRALKGTISSFDTDCWACSGSQLH